MFSIVVLCVTLTWPLVGPEPARPWAYPLDGRPMVIHEFAPPPQLQPWRRGNRGVDLAATAGAVVRAAGAGVVGFAGPLAGRGVVVIIHGPLRTTYEPVQPSVKVGDRVTISEPIGRVRSAPSPCPPRTCLHWGLLRGRVYLDPMLLLGGQVRLLPWLSAGAAPALSASATHVRSDLARARPRSSGGMDVNAWVLGFLAAGAGGTSLALIGARMRPATRGP
jgi:hypothetical protein